MRALYPRSPAESRLFHHEPARQDTTTDNAAKSADKSENSTYTGTFATHTHLCRSPGQIHDFHLVPDWKIQLRAPRVGFHLMHRPRGILILQQGIINVVHTGCTALSHMNGDTAIPVSAAVVAIFVFPFLLAHADHGSRCPHGFPLKRSILHQKPDTQAPGP